MTNISPVTTPILSTAHSRAASPAPSPSEVARAKETKEAFSQFVGETFFGQMLKSMRQTVGEPAYFHGGRAEEMFRTHLDQTLATEMTESSGKDLAEGMFRQQFPDLADVLRRHEAAGGDAAPGLERLSALRRW